jgi:hypothetical protein
MIYKVFPKSSPKEPIMTLNASNLEEAYMKALQIKQLESFDFDKLFTVEKSNLVESPNVGAANLLLG